MVDLLSKTIKKIIITYNFYGRFIVKDNKENYNNLIL
jgi:hypothetical protein